MWNPDSLDWDLFPRRQLRSWEFSLWNELKTSISSTISAAGCDTPVWKLYSNRNFSITSVKKAVHCSDPKNRNIFEQRIYTNLWKSSIPKKV